MKRKSETDNSSEDSSLDTTTSLLRNSSEIQIPPSAPTSPNLDDVLSSFTFGQFHWRMLILVGGGYFAVCSEMMLFIFLSSPLKKEWSLTDYEFPWFPFSTGIAGIIGGYVAGVASDKFGRRIPFLAGMIFIAIFGIASAAAPTFPSFIALRCFITIGTGTFEAVGFVLLIEFLPKKNRGTILVVVTLCGALGAVFAGGFAWLILPNWGWRWYVGVCAVPAFVVLSFEPFAFYESPRYLFICGKRDEGFRVLKEMAKMNKCSLPFEDAESVVVAKEKRGNILHLFSKDWRKQTLLFSTLWFLQATGYWGVTMYLPEYMDTLGVDPYLNMFTVFIGEIPGLFLAMIVIENHLFGRIGSLRVFSFVTAASLLVFSFIPKHIWKSVLIVVCYFSMVPIYSILNTFTPEVYSTEIRSTAMAWMNIVIEVPGLITPFIGATLLSSSLPWLYPVVWGCIFILQFFVTFTLNKEMAGKNLAERTGGSENMDNQQVTASDSSGERLDVNC